MTYTIPASNPFTQTAALDEIWALGLRNPWRFSFDRQTGDLYIGDVGQGAREEIDFQPASSTGGENYGWKILEGTICRPPTSGCTPPLNYSPPITDYSHPTGFAVTGGFVYRGPYYPRMQGMYFYADHSTGRIWGLKHDGMAWQGQELLDTSFNISTFGEDEAGNLYLAHRASGTSGTIYQIRDTIPPDLTQSNKTASPALGGVGDNFTFTINLINNGPPLTQTTYVTDTLPTGLNYVPGTLDAAFGTANNSGNTLFWAGKMNPTSTLQIIYQATATGEVIGTVSNLVQIKPEGATILIRTASVTILLETVYLPAILK